LGQFFESERLSGADKYFCAKCKSLQEATKSLALFRLPQVLVIRIQPRS
jgi:ubiquitin C-terminal hydrolase